MFLEKLEGTTLPWALVAEDFEKSWLPRYGGGRGKGKGVGGWAGDKVVRWFGLPGHKTPTIINDDNNNHHDDDHDHQGDGHHDDHQIPWNLIHNKFLANPRVFVGG